MKNSIAALSCLYLLACGGSSANDSAKEPTAPLGEQQTATPDQSETPTTETTGSETSSSEMSLEESTTLIRRVVELMTGLGAAAAAGGEDCEAMATALNTWVDANGAELKELEQKGAMIPESHQSELVAEAQKLAPAAQALQTSIAPCMSDEAVRQAVERL